MNATTGSLQGKTATIFGASSGIGHATALAFAAAGAAVTVASRREELLRDLAATIEKNGGRAQALRADVSLRADVDAAIEKTIASYGSLDIVVNCAGINIKERRFEQLTNASWDRIIATNLTGAFNTVHSAVAAMKPRGGGTIVQIGSVSGRYGDQSGPAYQASKHGMVGIAQGVMYEERLNGIRVTTILPALVNTTMPVLYRPVPPSKETMESALPPEDVAAACVFVASLSAQAFVPEIMMMSPKLQSV